MRATLPLYMRAGKRECVERNAGIAFTLSAYTGILHQSVLSFYNCLSWTFNSVILNSFQVYGAKWSNSLILIFPFFI